MLYIFEKRANNSDSLNDSNTAGICLIRAAKGDSIYIKLA